MQVKNRGNKSSTEFNAAWNCEALRPDAPFTVHQMMIKTSTYLHCSLQLHSLISHSLISGTPLLNDTASVDVIVNLYSATSKMVPSNCALGHMVRKQEAQSAYRTLPYITMIHFYSD